MISMMSPPFVNLALAAEDDTPTTTSSTIIDPAIQMPTITQKIFLDIKFEKYVEPKRLIIGLFGKDVPKTVENFVKLCTNGSNGGENESGASYVGSTFYRGTNVLL
jgi:peptidylprolyl isomerase